MTSSALERYRPTQPPPTRLPHVHMSVTEPAPRRRLGLAGGFYIAVIVFMAGGGLAASLGIL